MVVPSRHTFRLIVIAALLVQVGYATLFIIRTSCAVEGARYFSLFDDAMIALRYARNWSDGMGLVWNEGEYVEGYTSPLWTGILCLLSSLRLPDRVASLPVQVL